jgi:hypothetical protein
MAINEPEMSGDSSPPTEQRRGAEYDNRTTDAVRSVLVEIGQILGSFRGKFAVIGGAVPWLLLNQDEMPHVGTLDVDLGLDHEALAEGEYATLVEALRENGYDQNDRYKRFQLIRTVPPSDDGPAINVVVDFLMPRDAKPQKNDPPLIDNFAVIKASGADLALRFYEMVALTGTMPGGGENRVEIAVCSIPALLAMKGYALKGRLKEKDAYDVYYCVRNYPDGPEALAEACKAVLEHESGAEGYASIAEKFDKVDGFGPTCVRKFVEQEQVLRDRSPDEWQQDAFGQVDAWLRALGLRSS